MSSTTRFPIYTGDIIDGGRLQLLSVLGQGGFGVVYKAVDVLDPAHAVYAVKWLGLPTSSSHHQVSPGEHAQRLAKLEHEADMHARVSDHPNILTLHRTVTDDERECRWMVSDYISGGDVFDAQTQRNPFWRNDERTRSICLQLIDAVAHCHRQGVYHRDIKPENLLFSADGNTIYLSDFGCSTNKRYCTDIAGTTEYMAPGTL
jgi:serine/threonine protein kinase